MRCPNHSNHPAHLCPDTEITSEQMLKHLERVEAKYEICDYCSRRMKHEKGIHTFVCVCGLRVWYPERVGDVE